MKALDAAMTFPNKEFPASKDSLDLQGARAQLHATLLLCHCRKSVQTSIQLQGYSVFLLSQQGCFYPFLSFVQLMTRLSQVFTTYPCTN